jgi:glutaredoxin-like YruB-family protein
VKRIVKIKVYTTPTCPWCKKTKEFLKEKKIPFTNKDVSKDEAAKKEMFEKSNQSGVPVIEIGDTIIVGFNPDAIEKAVKKK